jgi:hypothetical protein
MHRNLRRVHKHRRNDYVVSSCLKVNADGVMITSDGTFIAFHNREARAWQ